MNVKNQDRLNQAIIDKADKESKAREAKNLAEGKGINETKSNRDVVNMYMSAAYGRR